MKKSTIKIKLDSNGNVRRVVGNVGDTRMNRAAAALWSGNIEPTTGYKLRRLIKRMGWTFQHFVDEAAAACQPDIPATEVKVIGLLEEGGKA